MPEQWAGHSLNMKNQKKTFHYLGRPGSYSFLAAMKYINNVNNLAGSDSFYRIFSNLKNKKHDFGIIPIENSLTGSITQNYDLLMKSDLYLVGELFLKIKHHLLVKRKDNINLMNLKYCYSHPEAIKQCDRFFREHKNIKPVFAKDTASAAKMLMEKKGGNCCAIANSYTATENNLQILNIEVQDDSDNFTRFAVIGNKIRKDGNKATIIFKVEHKPGSLLRTLVPYAEMGFNLTKIESRPIIGRPWEYIFIIDFIINNTASLNKLLSKMRMTTSYLKLLGRYEEGVSYDA